MTDRRQNAQDKTRQLIALFQTQPQSTSFGPLIRECEALAQAIAAFHMEGIRFRMYNVDRLLHRGELATPSAASALFAEIRQELEAAGFHTRSHQAPS
jgi:hypothetical protein